MQIGRDEISNDVITLGTCFSMFVYIRVFFRFVVIDENLTAQLMGNHRGIGRKIQNYFQRRSCKLFLLSFPHHPPPPQTPPPEWRGELSRRLNGKGRENHVDRIPRTTSISNLANWFLTVNDKKTKFQLKYVSFSDLIKWVLFYF